MLIKTEQMIWMPVLLPLLFKVVPASSLSCLVHKTFIASLHVFL